MAETKAGRSEPSRESSVTVTAEPVKRGGESRSLTIKLRKRKPDKKVEWSTDTVDNEHQGRMSSKCCCIYKKPRAFGESSTESEDEQDESCGHTHCIRGHPKVPRRPGPGPGGGGPSAALTLGAGPSQPPPDPSKP